MKDINTYPRPQFKRDSYYCLNGKWQLNNNDIIVPYCKECNLSFYPNKDREDILIYTKHFCLPDNFYTDKDKVVLHFDGVDQIAKVYINDNYLGSHEGGYIPFSFDITNYLQKSNILKVEVIDNNDLFYPYGKQSLKPSGMWYTPVSGIWKSVWIQTVPKIHEIKSIKINTTLDQVILDIDTDASFTLSIDFDDGTYTSTYDTNKVVIDLNSCGYNYQYWDTNNPKLYYFKVFTDSDTVESYFAIREIQIKDINDYKRLYLNNKPCYLNAVLDQGYYIDSLLTPKDNNDLINDILYMKELGFNTLRKHIKIEDELFYYYCDYYGMLVIQDMVNSGPVHYYKNIVFPTLGFQYQKDTKNIDIKRYDFFINHCIDTINLLYNHPCIISWTIYNESWGQQNANKAYDTLKKLDSNRLFDTCSGWYKNYHSDIDSNHIYFRNKVLKTKYKEKLLILSEFGGIKRKIDGHIFTQRKCNYGYATSNSEEELMNKIKDSYYKMLLPSINNGLCGSVFTQLSDVEEEINGLYTYDRQVCKVNKKQMLELNNMLYQAYTKACN